MKQQNDVVWNHQVFVSVKGSVIDLEDVEAIWIRLRELVEKKLIALAIDMGKLQKELLSSGRFHRTVNPKGFELPLPSA